MRESGPTLIESVRRALSLVDLVGEYDRPVAAKTLARRAGLALPTTYHLLRTLVHEGYLAKVDGGYLHGDHLARLALSRSLGLARVHAILGDLHQRLGAAAYLSLLDDGEIRLVDVADGPEARRVDLWVGFHDAAHATALGKAVLAVMDDESRADYLARHPLADLTRNTVTDRGTLLRQLDAGAEYVLDREEYALGTACVAAPVPSAEITAAVAVSVPARQVRRVVENADAVRRAALLVAYAVGA